MDKREFTLKPFEGNYIIHSNGDVWSIRKERYLKPIISNLGYVKHCLTGNDRIPKWFSAHQLVALTYLDKPVGYKTEVNHIDHNKLNNDVSNLEWITHKENIKKSWENGHRVCHWKGKQKPPYSLETRLKMSNAKFKRVGCVIKETGEYRKYESIQALVDDIGIHRKTFNRAINNRGQSSKYCFLYLK